MTSFDDVFSVYALFVLFRESLEASIICAVLLQFLDRTAPREKRQVWYGLAAGLGGAIIFGIIFVVIFYVAKNNIFSGNAKSIFRAVICWTACIIITMLAFAMMRFTGWEAKLKRKMEGLMAKAAARRKEALALQSAEAQQFPATDMLTGSEITQQRDGDRVMSAPPTVGMAAEAGAVSEPSLMASPPRAAHTVGAMTLALAPVPDAATPEATGLKRRSGGSSSGDAGCSSSDGNNKAAVAAAMAADDVDVEKGALVEHAGSRAVLAGAPSGVTDTDLSMFSAADYDMPWKERYAIFLVIFITVLREGIESVIFLAGVGNGKPSAIPLAGAVGFCLGVGFGVFLYYTGKQVKDLKIFMIVMAIILFFIAAGQAELGTYLLLHAGAFGYLDVWIADRPWWQVPQWDWSGCCSQYNNRFFGLINAIFGYVSMPTALEVIVYFSYWLVVISLGVYKYWKGTLFDADYKYTREMKKKALEEAEAIRLAQLKGDLEDGDDDEDSKDIMGLPPPKKLSSDKGSSSEDASSSKATTDMPPAGQGQPSKPYMY